METNETKHTPGPWGVWSIGGSQVITDNAMGRHLAKIINGAPEHEANARLIAAAPELLEALELALQGLDIAATKQLPEFIGFVLTADKARAAIAKARGGVR